jgi:precorrin-6A/cobalt-precorrin-6A reductase
MTRLLLLAGTAEARALADRIAPHVRLVVALSGATRHPAPYPGEVRTGGFGGAEGLADFLRRRRIDAVIDATHPFADRISANAATASAGQGLPYLHLRRPPWESGAGEVWRHHPDLAAALRSLPPRARPFLATGAGTVAALDSLPRLQVLLRSIEPLPDLPRWITHVRARPPFTVESEVELLVEFGATHVVSRNSGGASGREKLDAAALLGLPVLMIDRPPPPAGGTQVATVAAALFWLRHLCLLDTPSDPAP